jgi:AraC family transcriptional activator of tynA and feaB
MRADVTKHTEAPVTRTWSTLSSKPARQFAHWRELICEAFLDLTPESDLRDGFVGVVTQIPLGALSLARIDSQRQQVFRTARDIDRAPQHGYYANLQVRGTSTMTQGGRSTVLRPGDIALVDTTAEFTFELPEDFRQLTFFIPAPLLEVQLPGPVPTATRIETTTGVGAAVRHAMQAMIGSRLAPASAQRLAVHTAGMLAVALDPSLVDAGAAHSPRSYAAALADIEEHLSDDDLSPAATARRLGVSVRWLHSLFAGHQQTYAATVRRLRLEQVWRDLQDPARAQLRIIDIAADAGFANVASFHRTFRRTFGRSPAQVRAAGEAS